MADDNRIRELEDAVNKLATGQALQEQTLERVKTDLYNGDDGEHGLVARLNVMLTRDESRRGGAWTRSQKLAAVSILTVVIMPPLGWFAVQANEFVSNVNRITAWYDHHQKDLASEGQSFTPKKAGQ